MPILVAAPPVFTVEQETRIREIVRDELNTWYLANLPGLTDRDGKPYSPRLAFPRAVWAYDQIREGGYTEGRIDAGEAAEAADATADAAVEARVTRIEGALDDPILPPQ